MYPTEVFRGPPRQTVIVLIRARLWSGVLAGLFVGVSGRVDLPRRARLPPPEVWAPHCLPKDLRLFECFPPPRCLFAGPTRRAEQDFGRARGVPARHLGDGRVRPLPIPPLFPNFSFTFWVFAGFVRSHLPGQTS